MTGRKNIGGPKTPEGKSKVAKNATKHGLSTMKPADSSEQALIQNFSQELVNFYKPTSPLESFQIERIAICRAKLARLYEVESVRLQLTQKEFMSDPKIITKQLSGVHGVTRGMLLEQIRYGECRLPFGMESAILEKIAVDIFHFSGEITNEHVFARSFPTLTNFLNSLIDADESEECDLGKKLKQVCERIEKVFKAGDKYHEYLYPFIEELAELKIRKEQKNPSYTQEQVDELDDYNQRREELRDADRVAHQKPPPSKPSPPLPPPPIFSNHDEVMKMLEWFTKLWDCYEGLESAMVQFQSTQELMLKAMTLPTQESDLFMRYQTTLERRLSGAIGELLELQKMKSYLSG